MNKNFSNFTGIKPFIKKKKEQLKTYSTPITIITLLTLIWVASSVLLTKANKEQFNTNSLVKNRPSPTNFYAKIKFSYEDTENTEKKRKIAKENAAKIFILNKKKINIIEHDFQSFFNSVKKYNTATLKDIIPSSISRYASSPIPSNFLDELYKQGRFPESARLLAQLNHGIMSLTDKEKFRGSTPVKIELPNKIRRKEETVNDYLDPKRIANFYGNLIFPNNKEYAKLMAEITEKIIGKEGTLTFDEKKTLESEQAEVNKVIPVKKTIAKNSLLIGEKEIYTDAKAEMIKAHDALVPTTYSPESFFYNLGKCLFIIIFCSFFIFHLYPKLILDSKNLYIISSIVIISLFLDYYGICAFKQFASREGFDQKLIISAIPVAFAPIILTVITGYRTAICCGFLTCAITAMMILPYESFELCLRWFAIGSISALTVKNVKNYRTFFVKTLCVVLITTALINLDIILTYNGSFKDEIKYFSIILVINAFCVSIISLLLLFLFELVFNLDTDMALVAFSDYTHPVLERLKREAPGTLFHSICVATLAEDAAKEIGANPLKARVASLFHDIGKLSKPQYFTENNHDSSSIHLKLNPQVSSIIIRDHVNEGLALAKKYRLPRWIKEAIRTHHGDDLVYFFYTKALNMKHTEDNDSDPVLEMQFRYDGPPPTDKELVILSLADACEAASRCIDHPTPAKIKALINQIFQQRFKSNQLRNANISLAELNQIQKSFQTTLTNSNHGRIAYIAENINAKPSLSVEKSSSSQTN